MTEQEEEVVITQSGRLAGCRGRVRVALVVLAVLLLLLLMAALVRSMLSGKAPQPVKRAAAGEVAMVAGPDEPMGQSDTAVPTRPHDGAIGRPPRPPDAAANIREMFAPAHGTIISPG